SLRSAPPRAAGRSCGRRSSSSSDRTPPHLWGGPPEGRGGGRSSPPPRCARHLPAQRGGVVGGGLLRAPTGLLPTCGEGRPKGGEGVDRPLRLAALGTSPRSGEELWEAVFFELRPDSSPLVGRAARRAG